MFLVSTNLAQVGVSHPLQDMTSYNFSDASIILHAGGYIPLAVNVILAVMNTGDVNRVDLHAVPCS